MIHISEHFTYYELVHTSHKHLLLKNAFLGISFLSECFYLCEFLEQLRSFLGRPVSINSGYRCSSLNKVVGGGTSSDHLCFCAVDVPVHSYEVLELRKWLSRFSTVRYYKYYNSGYFHISLKCLSKDESLMYSTYYDDSFLLSLYREISSNNLYNS